MSILSAGGGDAFEEGIIEILPEFGRFDAELQAKLKRLPVARIKSYIDTKDTNRALDQAYTFSERRAKESQSRQLRTLQNQSRALERDIKNRKIVQTIEQRLDTTKFRAEETKLRHGANSKLYYEAALKTAEAEREIARFTRNRHMEIVANVKIKETREQLLTVAQKDAEKSKAGNRKDISPTKGPNALTTTILTLGTTVSPVVGSLTGDVVALGSAFATAGGAAGVFGIAATGQINRISAAMKAMKAGPIALSAPLQDVVNHVNDLNRAFRGFENATQGTTFSVFDHALSSASALLPRFVPLANAAATGINRILSLADKFTDSNPFNQFLKDSGTFGVRNMSALASIAEKVAEGVLDIVHAFQPLGSSVLNGIDSLATKFQKFASGLAGSDKFEQFVGFVQKNGPLVVSTVASVATALIKIGVAVAPLGVLLLKGIGGFFNLISKFNPNAILAIAGAIGAVTLAYKGILIVGQVGQALERFAAVMPKLSQAMGVTAKGAITLKGALIGLVASTVIGLAITAVVAAIEHFSAAEQEADERSQKHADNIQTVADAYDNLTKSVDAATNKQKLHDLQGTEINAGGNRVTRLLNGRFQSQDAKDSLYNIAVNSGSSESDILGGQQGDDQARSRVDANFQQHKADLQAKIPFTDNQKERDSLKDQVTLLDKAQKEYDATAVSAAQLKDQQDANNRAMGIYSTSVGSNTNLVNQNAASWRAWQLAQITDANVDLMGKFNALIAQSPEEQILQTVTAKRRELTADITAESRARLALSRVTVDNARAEQDAERAVTDAKFRVIDANRALKDSEADVIAARVAHKRAIEDEKRAEQTLSDAREDARRKLRDSYDTDLQNKLDQQSANQQVLATTGLDANDPRRIKALLDQKNANETAADDKLDNDKLRKKGINGADEVVDANRGLYDSKINVTKTAEAEKVAEENVTKARIDQKRATQDQKRATQDYNRTLVDNKNRLADAKTAVDNATTATQLARAELDKMNLAVKALNINLNKIPGTYAANLQLLGLATMKNGLVDTEIYIKAVYNLSQHPELTTKQAYNMAAADVVETRTPNPSGNLNPNLNSGSLQKADGGEIIGAGGGKDDKIPAMLSAGEHVWTSDEVRKAGGHGAVKRLRGVVAHLATGGGPLTKINGPKYDVSPLDPAQHIIDSGLLGTITAGATTGGTAGSGTAVGAGSGPGSIAEIIAAMGTAPKDIKVDGAGNRYTDNQGFMGKPHGGMTYHGRHEAVDFNYGSDTAMEHKIAMFWLNNYGSKLLELIHTDSGPPYVGEYIKNGKVVPPSFYQSVLNEHKNHVHVAGAPGFSKGATGFAGAGDVTEGLPPGTKPSDLKKLFLSGATGTTGKVVGSADVAKVAEATARASGATNKQILSVIEAGIVESNLTNLLGHTDHDSLGYLAQRPSQGWKHAADVAGATRDYINTAKRMDKASFTAGDLAWHVQRPATKYRSRYGQHRADAMAVINKDAPGIPTSVMDTGGRLLPGHAAINLSPHTEVVRNKQQEDSLGGMTTAEKREFAAMLAQAIQGQRIVGELEGKAIAKFSRKSVTDILRP